MGWELRDEVDDRPGCVGIAAHPDGPAHCGGQVGDRAATPAADFVAEQARPSQEPGADWSLGYDSSLTVLRPHRRHLDGRGHVIHVYLQRAVVQEILLLPRSVLGSVLGRPAGAADYLALAWLLAAIAIVGGAVGTGFASDDAVVQAAYGYRQRERRRQL